MGRESTERYSSLKRLLMAALKERSAHGAVCRFSSLTLLMKFCGGNHLHIPTWYYDLMNHDETRRAGLDLADVLIFK